MLVSLSAFAAAIMNGILTRRRSSFAICTESLQTEFSTIQTEWAKACDEAGLTLSRSVGTEIKKRLLSKEKKAKLNFSGCGLTDDHIVLLAEILKARPMVAKLDLRNNLITDKGLEALEGTLLHQISEWKHTDKAVSNKSYIGDLYFDVKNVHNTQLVERIALLTAKLRTVNAKLLIALERKKCPHVLQEKDVESIMTAVIGKVDKRLMESFRAKKDMYVGVHEKIVESELLTYLEHQGVLLSLSFQNEAWLDAQIQHFDAAQRDGSDSSVIHMMDSPVMNLGGKSVHGDSPDAHHHNDANHVTNWTSGTLGDLIGDNDDVPVLSMSPSEPGPLSARVDIAARLSVANPGPAATQTVGSSATLPTNSSSMMSSPSNESMSNPNHGSSQTPMPQQINKPPFAHSSSAQTVTNNLSSASLTYSPPKPLQRDSRDPREAISHYPYQNPNQPPSQSQQQSDIMVQTITEAAMSRFQSVSSRPDDVSSVTDTIDDNVSSYTAPTENESKRKIKFPNFNFFKKKEGRSSTVSDTGTVRGSLSMQTGAPYVKPATIPEEPFDIPQLAVEPSHLNLQQQPPPAAVTMSVEVPVQPADHFHQILATSAVIEAVERDRTISAESIKVETEECSSPSAAANSSKQKRSKKKGKSSSASPSRYHIKPKPSMDPIIDSGSGGATSPPSVSPIISHPMNPLSNSISSSLTISSKHSVSPGMSATLPPSQPSQSSHQLVATVTPSHPPEQRQRVDNVEFGDYLDLSDQQLQLVSLEVIRNCINKAAPTRRGSASSQLGDESQMDESSADISSDLDGQFRHVLNSSIRDLRQVQTIVLRNNRIDSFASFDGFNEAFPQLLNLDLGQNRFRGLSPPHLFPQPQQLLRLDLSFNQLTEVDCISVFTALQHLNLSNNRIQHLGALPPRLVSCDLSHNLIQHIVNIRPLGLCLQLEDLVISPNPLTITRTHSRATLEGGGGGGTCISAENTPIACHSTPGVTGLLLSSSSLDLNKSHSPMNASVTSFADSVDGWRSKVKSMLPSLHRLDKVALPKHSLQQRKLQLSASKPVQSPIQQVLPSTRASRRPKKQSVTREQQRERDEQRHHHYQLQQSYIRQQREVRDFQLSRHLTQKYATPLSQTELLDLQQRLSSSTESINNYLRATHMPNTYTATAAPPQQTKAIKSTQRNATAAAAVGTTYTHSGAAKKASATAMTPYDAMMMPRLEKWIESANHDLSHIIAEFYCASKLGLRRELNVNKADANPSGTAEAAPTPLQRFDSVLAPSAFYPSPQLPEGIQQYLSHCEGRKTSTEVIAMGFELLAHSKMLSTFLCDLSDYIAPMSPHSTLRDIRANIDNLMRTTAGQYVNNQLLAPSGMDYFARTAVPVEQEDGTVEYINLSTSTSFNSSSMYSSHSHLYQLIRAAALKAGLEEENPEEEEVDLRETATSSPHEQHSVSEEVIALTDSNIISDLSSSLLDDKGDYSKYMTHMKARLASRFRETKTESGLVSNRSSARSTPLDHRLSPNPGSYQRSAASPAVSTSSDTHHSLSGDRHSVPVVSLSLESQITAMEETAVSPYQPTQNYQPYQPSPMVDNYRYSDSSVAEESIGLSSSRLHREELNHHQQQLSEMDSSAHNYYLSNDFEYNVNEEEDEGHQLQPQSQLQLQQSTNDFTDDYNVNYDQSQQQPVEDDQDDGTDGYNYRRYEHEEEEDDSEDNSVHDNFQHQSADDGDDNGSPDHHETHKELTAYVNDDINDTNDNDDNDDSLLSESANDHIPAANESDYMSVNVDTNDEIDESDKYGTAIQSYPQRSPLQLLFSGSPSESHGLTRTDVFENEFANTQYELITTAANDGNDDADDEGQSMAETQLDSTVQYSDRWMDSTRTEPSIHIPDFSTGDLAQFSDQMDTSLVEDSSPEQQSSTTEVSLQVRDSPLVIQNDDCTSISADAPVAVSRSVSTSPQPLPNLEVKSISPVTESVTFQPIVPNTEPVEIADSTSPTTLPDSVSPPNTSITPTESDNSAKMSVKDRLKARMEMMKKKSEGG